MTDYSTVLNEIRTPTTEPPQMRDSAFADFGEAVAAACISDFGAISDVPMSRKDWGRLTGIIAANVRGHLYKMTYGRQPPN